MQKRNYICGGKKFAYGKAYILLPISLDGLPKTVSINGETLFLKTSFHASLVCAKNLAAGNADMEKKITDEFCEFANKNDISFTRFTGEFRFATKDEKKTLIALCEVRNLNELFIHLRSKLGMKIPDPPAHVTLYTLQPNIGIGLNSKEELESMSVRVEAPTEVRKALGF